MTITWHSTKSFSRAYQCGEFDTTGAELLIAEGAYPSGDPALHCPLLASSFRENSKFMKLLIDNGASVHSRVPEKAQDFYPEIMAYYKGVQPVHVAARACQLSAVRLLLESGADVNARDEYGHTPLMMAASVEMTKKGAVDSSAASSLPANCSKQGRIPDS